MPDPLTEVPRQNVTWALDLGPWCSLRAIEPDWRRTAMHPSIHIPELHRMYPRHDQHGELSHLAASSAFTFTHPSHLTVCLSDRSSRQSRGSVRDLIFPSRPFLAVQHLRPCEQRLRQLDPSHTPYAWPLVQSTGPDTDRSGRLTSREG